MHPPIIPSTYPPVDGSDYSAPVGGQILQFGPGSVALDIPLPLIADDLSEPNETLQASLGFPSESPVRVSIDSALATATITIFEHIMGECGIVCLHAI